MNTTDGNVLAYYQQSREYLDAALARMRSRPPDGQLLLRGATVISMDDQVGDLTVGDVLIEGTTIKAVGADLQATAAPDAVVVDVGGMILMPGLVDSHRHCWGNSLRRLITDVDLDGYLATTHTGMAKAYRPQDMYAGNLATMLGAIDGGVTCVLDFSHNSRSKAHSDAVMAANIDSGIRAVHASGPPETGEWDEQWPDDLERLLESYCSAPDSLISLRMAIVTRLVKPLPELLAIARGYGLGISIDAVMGPAASEMVLELGRADLLAEDISLIHCTDLTDEAWRAIVDSGTQVTLAPTSDAQIGICDGLPPIQKCLDYGIEPSLSVDVEMSLASDMYSQMRCVLTTQRSMAASRRYAGEDDVAMIGVRDVLRYATVQGARANGVLDKVGSLSPGKEADIVAIRAEDINNVPLNNAIGTIVLGTDARNVAAVFIAGQPVKWNGVLINADIGRARELAHAARDYIAAEVGLSVDPVRPKGLDYEPGDRASGRRPGEPV